MKYFTLQELSQSPTAKRLDIDNTPSEVVKQRLIALVDNLLDPVREDYGKPITVTSGYRCILLNRAIGSKDSSQHPLGEAVDLKCDNNRALFNLIKENYEFDQLIWEKGGKWIHVSFTTSRPNRKQVLYL